MPNWCDCELTITGPKDHLEEFRREATGEGSLFDFDRIIPYPDDFRALDRVAEAWRKQVPEERTGPCPRDGYNQGGYAWCVAHWGTKWNACRVRVAADEGSGEDGAADASLRLEFDTAWSPPRPVIVRAAERFPELTFELRYFESGSRVQGILVCEAGKTVVGADWSYSGRRGG